MKHLVSTEVKFHERKIIFVELQLALNSYLGFGSSKSKLDNNTFNAKPCRVLSSILKHFVSTEVMVLNFSSKVYLYSQIEPRRLFDKMAVQYGITTELMKLNRQVCKAVKIYTEIRHHYFRARYGLVW